jgi:hypothetical protein
MERSRTTGFLASSFAGGLAAGLLYSSVVFGFVFLLPVQVIYGRRGKREGLLASVWALVFALVGQVITILVAGIAGGTGFDLASLGNLDAIKSLSLAVVPPAVLLAALGIMNAPFWKRGQDFARGFSGAALASAVAIPGLVLLAGDAGFLSYFEERLDAFIQPMLAQAGTGFEASVLRSSVDAKTLASTSMTILFCSFSALLLAWLGASWWVGNRISGVGTKGWEETSSLADYRLPYLLVWAFLGAWAGVLGVSYFKLPMPWQGIAWNLALVLGLAYTAQGLGIASHLMRRWNLPRSLRICLAFTGLILLCTPPVGTAAMALLPILGVTEVWIPYRNPKGAGA